MFFFCFLFCFLKQQIIVNTILSPRDLLIFKGHKHFKWKWKRKTHFTHKRSRFTLYFIFINANASTVERNLLYNTAFDYCWENPKFWKIYFISVLVSDIGILMQVCKKTLHFFIYYYFFYEGLFLLPHVVSQAHNTPTWQTQNNYCARK